MSGQRQSLLEWCEEMSRHNLALAKSANEKQRARALRFRSKRLAQCAATLREDVKLLKDASDLLRWYRTKDASADPSATLLIDRIRQRIEASTK